MRIPEYESTLIRITGLFTHNMTIRIDAQVRRPFNTHLVVQTEFGFKFNTVQEPFSINRFGIMPERIQSEQLIRIQVLIRIKMLV
jgi:hypothetical protein